MGLWTEVRCVFRRENWGWKSSAVRIGIMLRHLGEKGGIVVYTRRLLDALLALDRENDYVLLYRDRNHAVSEWTQPRTKSVVLRARSRISWDQVAVLTAARRERLDFIFNPKLSVPLLASCPTAFMLHGAEQFAHQELFPFLDRLYVRAFMPLYCRKATALLTPSEAAKLDVARCVGVDPGKVFSVHHGIDPHFRPVTDPSRREAVRSRYHLPDRFLLFVGGLTPLKNLPGMLRAFSLLQNRIPHHLVLAGFQRWGFSQDGSLIESLGLKERIAFPGWVAEDDLPSLYSLAEALIFPSIYEGFGLPIIEAQACGCPVVTSASGSMPEVSGGAALLVDPRNPEAIADAVEQLVTDPTLREKLVAKGLAWAARLTWEDAARQTLEIFRRAGGR